jgi:hypothetical protein
MAKRAKRAKESKPNVAVSVPVPQDHTITVTDLKSLNDEELKKALEKAKTAKVGFVILNAPFKVRPVESVS